MPRRPPSVPAPLVELAGRQEGLVSIRQCHQHGLTTRIVAGMAMRGQVTRVARGVYDIGRPVSSRFDQWDRRRRRAALLGALAHPGSVASGVAALVLHEVEGTPIDVRPEVTFPDGSPRRSGGPVRVRRTRLHEWLLVGEIPVAHPEDALVQAVPGLDRRTAVAVMDSARNQGIVNDQRFTAARRRDSRAAGGVGRRSWWSASDRRADSPAETWARLSCLDAGFPPDALQLKVLGPRTDRVVAKVDLAWILADGSALLVEIDGRDAHSGPEALYGDRSRQNRITGRNTRLLRFTGRDARDGVVAREVGEVLRSAGWSPHPVHASFRYRLA